VTTKPRFSKRALALAAAGLLTAGIAACSSSSSAPSSTTTGATLVMESSPENGITQDFNPFVSTAAPQGMGATGLIYEPLYQFDLANPTIKYPWLATTFAWGPQGKSITFTIRSGVKWSNGTPMTAADVAFTYTYIKQHPAINLAGLNIGTVTSSGDTVTVTFPTPQYTNLENIAGVAVLPESIWASIKDPSTFTDSDPIGTGPYTLGSFTPSGFTMIRNPNYWQLSKVQVPKVYFPVYSSNTGALSALFADQIDWTGNYIPNLQRDFVDTNPADHHYWEAAGSSNALWPNLNVWPTNQYPVREAIDLAINRTEIGAAGESGLESPLTNASGLTLPTFQAWSGPIADDTVTSTGDVSEAKSVLTHAGYTMNTSTGFFEMDGRTLALNLIDPSSYTDYAQDDALIAQQLRAAGIDATFVGQSVTKWNANVADGNFQLTLHWGSNGVTPYNLYDNWLDDTLVRPTGATGDFERLQDPTIESDLVALSSAAPNVQAQAAALAPIAKYVAQNLPVIPTTTAADWFEYNSQNYVGWPTQTTPYDSGEPSGTDNGPGTGSDEVVLLHLTPAG